MASKRFSQLAAAGTLIGSELLALSKLSASVTIIATTISAQASDNSYNDSGNGFVSAGFVIGMAVKVVGFTGNAANNILSGVITALTAGKMSIGGADGDVIVDDAAGESVTITAWESARTTAQAVADLAAAGSGLTGWLNVKDYGAVGDGTTDDSTAIGAAVAAVNATAQGAILYWPPGVYKTAGGHAFTKPVHMIGLGGALYSGATISAITCSSTTAKLFDFQSGSQGSMVEGLHMTCSGTATAGAGLYFTQGDSARVLDCTFTGFWIDIDFENASEWQVRGCNIRGPRKYAMRVRNVALPDGGDWLIDSCTFATGVTSDAAIYIGSSGGGKIVGVKINGAASTFVNGIFLDVASGVTTSILEVLGGSIENVSGAPIKMRNASGASWQLIKIIGVQFGLGSVNVNAIDVSCTGSGAFDYLTIHGCVFGGGGGASNAAVSLTNIVNASLGVCENQHHTKLLALSGCSNIRNDNARYNTDSVTDGATLTIDNTNFENGRVTLGGNRTLANPTTVYSGQVYNLRVLQDGTGSRTLAYGSKFKFPAGVTPVLSTAASAKDMLSFQYDGNDDTWNCVIQKGFA